MFIIKKFSNLKLKTKMVLFNIGIILLFGCSVFIQFENGQKAQKREIDKNFGMYSRNLNSAIAENFYTLYSNVQTFSLNGAFSEKKVDQANFYLNEYVNLYPQYDFLLFLDSSGKYLASTSLSATGEKLNVGFLKDENFSNLPWFELAKKGGSTEDTQKKIFGTTFFGPVKDALISKVYNGKERYGTYFVATVTNEYAEPVGYLVSFVNFTWLEGEMTRLFDTLKSGGMSSAYIAVLNKENQILGSLEPSSNGGKNEVIRDFDKSVLKPFSFAENDQFLTSKLDVSHQKFLDKLGWKIFIKINKDDAYSGITVSSQIFYISFLVSIIICGVITMLYSARLPKRLQAISDELKDNSQKTMSASHVLHQSSETLNDSAVQQASAIQETASTLHEFAAMIKMSTKNAKESLELVKTSEKVAEEGKEIGEKVIYAVGEIKSCNDQILETTTASNKKINEIVDIINEISEKTKVINDIVFQTKLLSFNASVEAARAGEHGKGFAVVAEEVGNLARMSGKAAEEIFTILNNGTQKVQSIVGETQESIEKIMETSSQKISNGGEIVKHSQTKLDEIVENVKRMNVLVQEITTASTEQENGIVNIQQAIQDIQKTTQSTSKTSDETLSYAEQFTNQAASLQKIADVLDHEVSGNRNGNDIASYKKEMANQLQSDSPAPSKDDDRFDEAG